MKKRIDATARLNNAGCFFFGFSADIRFPFDPNNHTFIKELIDLLDKEGVMLPKYFCFINEFGSTNVVEPKIGQQYPWLTDVDQFVRMYPKIDDFQCYLDRADIRFPFDSNNYTFIKELIDLLDKEGVMLPRYFCFINEFGSTNVVEPKIGQQYPWLTDVDQFVRMYPKIDDFQCCLDRGDLWS
ncbi:hypothetical protein Q3G72_006894 [Acer saccharum]|nr:hypothetical protein Q3G72_006894 [Acer saccharum]